MKNEHIASSVTELIGETPLLRASRFAAAAGISNAPLLKLEYLNPAGSVKDRAALKMIEDAEKAGKLKPGAVIVEPTSGNTGIGLASIAAARGYRVVLTMPETMSAERRKLLSVYGAEIVLTPGKDGMRGAIEKADEIAKSTPGSFIPAQFENPSNPAAHYETTGPELVQQTDGKLDIFVAGIGTGGTITGIGEVLKAQNPDMVIWAVEPENAAILAGGTIGTHLQMGIGDGVIPDILNREIYDDIYIVTDEEAIQTSKDLARLEGIMCGISSGTNVAAALKLARKLGKGKTVVTVLPDTAERYFSTPLFANE